MTVPPARELIRAAVPIPAPTWHKPHSGARRHQRLGVGALLGCDSKIGIGTRLWVSASSASIWTSRSTDPFGRVDPKNLGGVLAGLLAATLPPKPGVKNL